MQLRKILTTVYLLKECREGLTESNVRTFGSLQIAVELLPQQLALEHPELGCFVLIL